MSALVMVALLSMGQIAPAVSEPRIVFIPGPLPPALRARIDGQLSDLSWVVRRGPRSASVRTAPAKAAAIVSFSLIKGGGLTVRLSLPDGRRFRRDIRGLGPAATYEATALVLRSALLALDEGAAPAWTYEPPATPQAQTGPSGWGWTVAGRTEANGIAAVAGLEVGAFRRTNRWALGLRGAGRLPFSTSDPGFTLNLARYDLGIAAGWDIDLDTDWLLGGRLHAGAALWYRTTEDTEVGVEAASARWLVSPVTGAAARLARRLAPGWTVDLTVGVDVVWRAPEWTLADGTAVESPWLAQPWVTLGFTAEPYFDEGR